MVREQQPWLDVPFGEKDDAKAAGALWDWRAKRWYAPRPGMAELARWLPAHRDEAPPAEAESDLSLTRPVDETESDVLPRSPSRPRSCSPRPSGG